MKLSVSSSHKHHGKRVRTVFSTDDDSRAGTDAIFAALKEHQLNGRKAAAAKVVRQSYRKKKAKDA